MSWVTTVPQLTDGSSQLDSNTLNVPLNALAARTEYLYNAINAMTSGQALLIRTLSISTTCTKGKLVYFNSATRLWEQAAALWGDISELDGSQRPALSAYPEALVVDVDVNHYATLLLQGISTDPSVITAVTEGTNAPGLYYLTSAGACTLSSQPLAVPCIKVLTDGSLIFTPVRPDHRGHTHFTQPLTAGWFVSSTFEGTATIPTGAVYGYNIAGDSSMEALLPVIRNHAALVVDGMESSPLDFVINEDNIWLLTDMDVDSSFILHGVTPFLGTEPLIRGMVINPDNSFLAVKAVQNTAVLDMNLPAATPNETDGYTGMGITGFTAAKVPIYGQVVQRLNAGPGISIVSGARPGFKTIGASAVTDTDLEAMVINLDSALELTGSNSIFMQFPAGINSSVTGVVHLPAFAVGTVSMRPVILYKGNGGTIAACDVEILTQSIPALGSSAARVTSTLTGTIPQVTGTADNTIYRVGSTLTADAVGGSRVSITIRATAPTTAITFQYFGLMLTLK